MKSILSFWWTIFLLPLPICGVIFTIIPEKVIIILSRIQQTMFKSFNMTETGIANSIYSIIFDENYSKRLQEQQTTPRKFKGLMIGIRFLGIFFLLIFALVIFIIAEYIAGLRGLGLALLYTLRNLIFV